MMDSTALPEGADSTGNSAWKIPYLRTLSKATDVLLENNQEGAHSSMIQAKWQSRQKFNREKQWKNQEEPS